MGLALSCAKGPEAQVQPNQLEQPKPKPEVVEAMAVFEKMVRKVNERKEGMEVLPDVDGFVAVLDLSACHDKTKTGQPNAVSLRSMEMSPTHGTVPNPASPSVHAMRVRSARVCDNEGSANFDEKIVFGHEPNYKPVRKFYVEAMGSAGFIVPDEPWTTPEAKAAAEKMFKTKE